jgi:hypothetical protein
MSLGLVFGFAHLTHNASGQPYCDTDAQSIADENMVISAWRDFMQAGGQLKAQHDGGQIGQVVFAMPLTPSVAASLGITGLQNYGIVVGVQITDAATMAAYQAGTFSGFSVGGSAQWQDDPVAKRIAKMRFDGKVNPQTAVQFKLIELSLVGSPAQEDALITLAKRADVSVADLLQKQRDTAAELFGQLAKQHAADHGCRMSAAYAAICQTEAGKTLYSISTTTIPEICRYA